MTGHLSSSGPGPTVKFREKDCNSTTDVTGPSKWLGRTVTYDLVGPEVWDGPLYPRPGECMTVMGT